MDNYDPPPLVHAEKVPKYWYLYNADWADEVLSRQGKLRTPT